MTFDQLEYFIAIAEHDTFLEAADTLHITQSTLSKQILKLEKELDVALLDRSHRSASLSEAGELFYQEALKLDTEYQHMLARIRKHQSQSKSGLHIGTLPFLTQYQLTSRFQAFKETYPDIHLAIDEVEEIDLMNGLESDRYDLVIARQQMIDSEKYQTHLLTEDELVVVLPTDHCLMKKAYKKEGGNFSPSLHFTDISSEAFIFMNRYTSIYQLCIDLFAKQGMTPNILRTARVESILSAVTVGEGISLLPKSNLSVFHHENIAAVSLDPPIVLPVVLAVPKKRMASGNCRQLMNFLS